ncbi:MAG: M28 family peptidase [Candidatus Eremiobacteraeota bacterium]|nr:M28 family peptidase [Candidatus Eremiobacteraeota bacterium]
MAEAVPQSEAQLRAHVSEFSFPRFAGGEGERRALSLLRERLRSWGMAPEEVSFQVSRFPFLFFFKAVVALWGGGLALSLSTLTRFPQLSLVFIAVTAGAVAFFSRWHPWMERLYNVPLFGTVESATLHGQLGSDPDSKAPHLVFMAHYDSKSQLLPGFIRALVSFLGLFALLALSAASLVVVFLPGWGSGVPAVVAYGSGAIMAVMILLMLFNPSQDKSPGAMDNASGVAVLLALSRHFSLEPPGGAVLHFLFTGAEEIGLCGSFRFLAERQQDFPPERTYVVNLDGVGGTEKLLVVDSYGFPPSITARRLGKFIRNRARALGVRLHRAPLVLGALWDHVVWGARGYESVTLSVGGWDRATLSVHSSDDSERHINAGALSLAFKICVDWVSSGEEMEGFAQNK